MEAPKESLVARDDRTRFCDLRIARKRDLTRSFNRKMAEGLHFSSRGLSELAKWTLHLANEVLDGFAAGLGTSEQARRARPREGPFGRCSRPTNTRRWLIVSRVNQWPLNQSPSLYECRRSKTNDLLHTRFCHLADSASEWVQVNVDQLGRTVLRIYQHIKERPMTGSMTFFGASLKAGRSIDFAARIRRRRDLDHPKIVAYARFAGLDLSDLILVALPKLKEVGVVDYQLDGSEISRIDEYVGVSAPLLNQTASVWNAFLPGDVERCAVESADLAAHAPLCVSDHFGALEAAGFRSAVVESAITALDAVGLVQRSRPPDLPEEMIYNEYVWGDNPVSIARFLKSLPANERDVLTAISGEAMHHPGVPMSHLGQSLGGDVLRAAQKVGFIDAPRVITKDGRGQNFVFSPEFESALAASNSTDALHERKLFVAHILFGHHFSPYHRGQILDPVVLVRALLRRGKVGPASAIKSDYPLLESFGIVKVTDAEEAPGRAYLEVVKADVIKDGLQLLEATVDEKPDSDADEGISSLWLPGTFVSPEQVRAKASELRPGPEKDLFDSSIDVLRQEVAKTTRGEDLP